MKKVLAVAAVLALSAGAASASSYGGWFGSKWSWKAPAKKVSVWKGSTGSKCFVLCKIVKKVKAKKPQPTTPAVPVPAAGFLLVGGLGGLALMKRRKG